MPVSSKVSPSNGPAAVEGSCSVKIFVIGVSLVLVLLAIPDVELSAELVKTCLTKGGFFLPPAAAPSEFKENPTKTRQGGLNTNHCSVLPKMFATGGQRCPVELLKQYLSRRPQELRDKGPFYLAIIENPKTNVWYKKQRLGVNSIDNMMKSVVKNTALETSKKKLTNHTARKTVVKKLRAASVERQSIIQVTGHASEKSLNDYDEGSEKEQPDSFQTLSAMLHSQQPPAVFLVYQCGLLLQRLQRVNR